MNVRSKFGVRSLVMVALFSLGCAMGRAQINSGSLGGTVADATGSVIPRRTADGDRDGVGHGI